MSRFRPVVLAFAFTLLASLAAFAQTGSVRGTVTDQSGAIVIGADVSARNTATGVVRATTTNDTGAYSLNDLPAGVYELSIKKANFKSYLVSKLELTVAQVLSVNATLDTGGEEQTIEVRGDKVSDVDLETSQVSNLVDQRKMVDLPLITRDPYSLVLLSPGTMQTNTSLGGFSVNGSRERNNNFMLDGSDNNDTSVPGIPDGVLSANPDSTEQFRVITNNFDAEYGRNTGAIIDVVTKSGTNLFHGSAYEYGRWNGFGGARDWFNPGTGPNASPMNPYVRNQFGYSIGGPIKKDKTFFFFNQEMDRFRTATTGSATVPTAAFKTGVFTFTGSAGPVAVDLRPSNPTQNPNGLPLDPTMQSIFALYPNPTVNNPDGYTGTVFFPTGSKQNSYNQIFKLDHHFTDSETFSATYGYDHTSDPDPFHDDILPGGVGATSSKSIGEALSANLNSVLSPTLVNDFRFGWNHIYAAFACNHTELDSVSPLDQFGKGRDYTMNPFTSFGCLSLVANGQDRKTGTVSYDESLTWVHGAHTFKFGFEFRNVGESGSDNFFSRRQVLTDSVTVGGPGFSLIDGVPGATTQLEDAASALYGFVIQDQEGEFFDKAGNRVGSDNKFFRQHEYDGFIQDSWKIRHNLTIDAGLRYQFDGVPYEENGNFSNLLLASPDSFTAGQNVTFSDVGPGTGNQLYHNDWSNIEPRLGFSWDPWGDGKTAVRAGFGIFHDRAFGNLFGNVRGNPPFEDDYVNFPLETIGNFFGSDQFPTVAPTTTPSPIVADGSAIATVLFDPHFRNPSSNNWNLDIQRTIAPGTTLDVAYIGSKGTHIFREVDGNPPDPNLVNQLLAFCVPTNPQNTEGCDADTVTKSNLTEGTLFGSLPFNAIANNALVEPLVIRSIGNSNYNSLQVKATRQMSHGLEVQGSYTWAHSIDDSGDPIVPGAGNRGLPRNSRDISEERGNSDDDIRHVAVINYIWQVPLGKGRSYMNHGAMGRVLEGFQFSGITSLQSGIPFDVYSTTDMERTGLSGRADLVGDPFAAGSNPNASNGKVFFTNIDAFSNRGADPGGLTGGPLFEGPGTVGRNRFHGPDYINFNLSLAKQMAITERIGMEIRCEAYNIFNHPEFTNPGSDPGALGNQFGSPLFGIITSTRTQPDGTTSARQLQMALRLTF